MDFTVSTYKELLKALQQQGFSFQTFEEYLDSPTQPQPERLASLYPPDKSGQALEEKDRPTNVFMSESPPPESFREGVPIVIGRGARAEKEKQKRIILRPAYLPLN